MLMLELELELELINTLTIQEEAGIAKDSFAKAAHEIHGTRREASLGHLHKARNAFGAPVPLGTYQAQNKNYRNNFPCQHGRHFLAKNS